MFTWARRYVGLDTRNLSTTSWAMRNATKGVSWLTMLDLDLTSKIGGLSTLESQLGKGFPIHQGPNGIVIQAGPEPLLGDVSRLEDVSPYVKVNEVTRSIRAEAIAPLPGFEIDTTAEWLRRFDRD